MADTILHYQSIADLRGMIAAPWKHGTNRERAVDYVEGNHGGTSWYGVHGGAPAVIKLIENGYPAGEAMLQGFRTKIEARLPIAVGAGRRRVFGSQGDSLDIHRLNSGAVFTAWESRKRLVKRGNTSIRIVCDIGGNCGVSSDRLAWRGVAALVLAQIMQKARYKAEIVAANAVRGHVDGDYKHKMLMTCTIKAAGVHADYAQLAAVLTISGFFRTLGFTNIVRDCDDHGKIATHGLGHSVSVESMVKPVDRISQIVVPHDVACEETAAKWLESAVKMLQGTKRA